MLILEYGPICACLTNVELFPLHAQFIISCWVLRWGHMPWHYVCCVSAVIGFSLLDHFCTQAFRMLEDITHIFLSQTLNCLSRRPSLIFFLDMPLNKSSIFFYFFWWKINPPGLWTEWRWGCSVPLTFTSNCLCCCERKIDQFWVCGMSTGPKCLSHQLYELYQTRKICATGSLTKHLAILVTAIQKKKYYSCNIKKLCIV